MGRTKIQYYFIFRWFYGQAFKIKKNLENRDWELKYDQIFSGVILDKPLKLHNCVLRLIIRVEI